MCNLDKQVRDLSGNLATMKTEYTGNWLNDTQSFPPLCGTSRNVTQSASHSDDRKLETYRPTSQGSQAQSLSESSDEASNYVDAVKVIPKNTDDNIGDNAEGFQTVQKRRKRTKFVTGNRQQGSQLQGVSRKSVFCINRLKPETTVDIVTDYLQSQNIKSQQSQLLFRGEAWRPTVIRYCEREQYQ